MRNNLQIVSLGSIIGIIINCKIYMTIIMMIRKKCLNTFGSSIA